MRGLICAVLMLLAPAVVAQDRMTRTSCDASWMLLLDAVQLNGDVTVAMGDDGWCEIVDATFDLDARTRVGVSSLRWRGGDFDRLIDDQLPPRSLEVRGTGLQIIPVTGNATFDYLLGVQMSGMSISFGFSLRWDGLQNALILNDADLTFDATNKIEVRGRVDGVDLTDLATMQTSIGRAGLRDLSVRSDFDGWFESIAVMILGDLLLRDDGPAPHAQVAALKSQAYAFIDALPQDFMPEPSRVALSAFVADLPRPRGSMQLELTAEPVLGMVRAMPLMLSGETPDLDAFMAQMTNGVTVLFTWSRARAQ